MMEEKNFEGSVNSVNGELNRGMLLTWNMSGGVTPGTRPPVSVACSTLTALATADI